MSAERFDAGMYIIDKEYKILYLNRMTHELYPEVKVGDICHKALEGSDIPCCHCPIREPSMRESLFYNGFRNEWVSAGVAAMELPEHGTCYNIQFHIKNVNAGGKR